MTLTNKEIADICKRIPTFIKQCENDLGEDEHKITHPITHEEFKKIEWLIETKLPNCLNYVDLNIFD